MKYVFFLVIYLCTFPVFAQNISGVDTPTLYNNQALPPVINEVPVNQPAASVTMDIQQGQMVVLIPQARLKDVQKDWAKYVGYGSKGKAASADGQYSQYGAVNKNISPDPFNITAKFLSTSDGVRVTVWLSDNNNFQNTNEPSGDRSLALQKYVHDFAVTEYKQAVVYELDDDKAQQKAMEDQLTKMIREEDKAAKRKEEDNRSIIKANDAIITNRQDIQATSAQIESQKGMVQTTASDPNATKGAEKTLRELEKDKRELQKRNDNESKYILLWTNDITASERVIADNRERQANQRAAIERQKQVILQVQAKLENIR